MANRNGTGASWLALVAAVVTMGLVAYIVKTDGPVGEVGSSAFWGIFAIVLVGAVVMIVALSKAITAQRGTPGSSPRTVDSES
jgi:hypothetical protein